MPSSRVEIINRLGLHARAAAKLVQTASRYGAEVSLTRNDKTVNGKSIMGVMMLAAAQGTEIEVETRGEDADDRGNRIRIDEHCADCGLLGCCAVRLRCERCNHESVWVSEGRNE